MLQPIDCTNVTDDNGNPLGGKVLGRGINIEWQSGPLGRGEDRQQPNGAFVEGVIAAAHQRLLYYQTATNGRFRCRENSLAITKLEEALHWLQARTEDREQRGVEGTHEL